jgi:hypothetical protein
MNVTGLFAAVVFAAALAAFPAAAQQRKTVDGVVINIGILGALMAEHVDAQHGVHKGAHGSGMEHVVISLAEEKGGARIGDAEVSVEVKNPNGVMQKKPLMAMITAGFPDYSEVFDFGWTGRYIVRVSIRRKGAAHAVKASFTVNRAI